MGYTKENNITLSIVCDKCQYKDRFTGSTVGGAIKAAQNAGWKIKRQALGKHGHGLAFCPKHYLTKSTAIYVNIDR
jgi:hypothetical protein